MDDLRIVRALIEAKLAAYRERPCASAGVRWSCKGVSKEAIPVLYEEKSVSRLGKLRRIFKTQKVPENKPHPPNLHAAVLSFAARVVIAVRDRFAGDAPRVYKAAGVTSSAYSQIVSDETHKVNKHTAVRFAFALKLSPEEARLLLKSAGHSFSESRTEDFILEACLEANPPIYDFATINALLKEYGVDYQY